MAENIKMYEIDGHHIRFNCCDNTLAILYNESDNLSEPKACPFCGMNFEDIQYPRLLEEWGEDYGDVLWWKFPIEEPPYVGSPLSADWPGYHTHWLPIPVPKTPKEFIDD